MSFPDTPYSTEWAKYSNTTELVFVGRDTLALSAGCHISFYSLTLNTCKVYSANRPHLGDGVNCYTGHRIIPVLAFAEKCLNPNIIFLSYPQMEHIQVLKNGAPEGYMTLAFSDHEYLVTLSDLPEFEIAIWNWRTGQKLATKKTHDHNSKQILNVSSHYPVCVAQYTINAKRISMWNIYNAYKECILIKKEIQIPFHDHIVEALWNPEGSFFILNKIGCIYMLNADSKLQIIIYGLIIGTGIPCFTWYKGGFVIMQPSSQIKHFKKYEEWSEDWDVESMKLKKLIPAYGKDCLIGWTYNGDIMELNSTLHKFVKKKNMHSNVSDYQFIYPVCNYFVTLTRDGMSLNLFELNTGKMMHSTSLNSQISVISANPIYPYIAAGLVSGLLILMSYYNAEAPKILTKFRLYRGKITRVEFNEQGNLICTAQMQEGLFFIIKGEPGQTMEIISYIDYKRPAIDIVIMEDEKSYKLLILVQSDETKFAGQRIVVKMVSKASKKVKKKKYTCPQNNISGFFISKNIFYAKILGERVIRQFQLQKKNIHFVNEYECSTIPVIFNIKKAGDHFFLYGYNGYVLIFEKDIGIPLAAFQVSHRKDGGVRNALVDPYLRYLVTLGKHNELICTKIGTSLTSDKALRNALWTYYGFKEIFNTPTIGFYPDEDVTCLEMKEHEILIEEQKTNAKERKQIMDEFVSLKKEVITLLNQNIHGPELEKIDITEFYLHTKLKEHKEELCEKECEWTVKYYNELIRSQTELWECMKKKFWDTQEIKRSIINGISSNFHVENYGMIPLDKQFHFFYNYVTMFREFEEMLRAGDQFLPWVPKTSSSLQMTLEKVPIIKYKSEETRIIEALEDIDDDAPVEPKEHYPSSTAAEFIEEEYFYDQEEIHTYTQNYIQKMLMNHTSILLRKMFNKQYDDMMDHKKREMDSIIEKNERLRFILSELKNHTIHIRDPKWHPSETPESIMIVKDNEIGIRPYISPSRQAILDWEAAEAERIRLLLLADDFRERALMKMMDGVLEVRWEDTLKRDIPKPKCMLEKEPELFNEEDLRAIRDYEEKVAFLNSERQRYRNMLEMEYGKVAENVRECHKKFNTKLRDLYILKIRTETARMQHTLMGQLMQEICFKRQDFDKKEEGVCVDIQTIEDESTWMATKIADLMEYQTECKSISETLSAKDKTIDKNFKKEFQDFNSLIQEQSYKLFKKQPKISFKNINIPSLLILCGTCITTGDKDMKYLTAECVDYIKSVEKLDEYVGIPTAIDENTYKVICKFRNMRFENDLRIKANQLDLNDLDVVIQYFQKIYTDAKERISTLVNNLAKIRYDKIMVVHDKRLQIVVKRGLVEVATTGLMADFDTSIMVDRHDIEHINKIIIKAGDRKLKVMREKMFHRRQILEKEWEHKKKKMEIQDLNEYLHMVDKVKVTKEIQRYLRQKAKGESFDKGLLTLDQEVECKRKSYEKVISDRKKSIAELDKQIKDYKKKNSILDQKIAEVNIQVCEQHELRDKEFERNNKEMLEKRMQAIKRRSKVVKTIQDQHNEILILQTELELARLKTFPTIKYQTLD